MKKHAPATERNREAILHVLRSIVPDGGRVVEIASGSGQHAVYFAHELDNVSWQPTDRDSAALASIQGWIAESRARLGTDDRLADPLALDVMSEPWPVQRADVVVCINMVHISPWQATLALLRGAGRVLAADGVLYLYGPYRVQGKDTAPSNETFDLWLKDQDEQWGIRQLHEVEEQARQHQLVLERVVEMPANNLSVVLRKQP